MIYQGAPKHDVDLNIQDPQNLAWPSAEEFQDWSEGGHLANHQFLDLRGLDWDIAEMLLEGDKSILRRAAAISSSEEDFMDVLQQTEDEIIFGEDSEYESSYFVFEAGIHGVIGRP